MSVLFFTFLVRGQSQFAPPAGQPNSTAIYKDSSIFVAWADICTIIRGWKDMADTTQGVVSYGVDTNGIGIADNHVVSLGDGGVAIVKFKHPIVNGVGFDFAVFENAFDDSFLELSFVEVSSDSIHFIRFPAVSLTDTTTQVGSFGMLDATKIHNFGGKYRAEYGTPFDLEDLKDSANLDVNNIRFIKIRDVVGTINDSLCTRDSQGNKVNDPYPTAFESGGFDLDAIGVINADFQDIALSNQNGEIRVFPNPVSPDGNLCIQLKNAKFRTVHIEIFNTLGQLIFAKNVLTNDHQAIITLYHWQTGLYLINVETNDSCYKSKFLVF